MKLADPLVTLADPVVTAPREAPPLPDSLRANRRLNQWLRFSRDGYVEVRSGKVEIGQGIATALAQIVAEELDVTLRQVRMIAANTARSPNEGVTSGSLSIQNSGTALRHACAQARALYLRQAARHLQLSAETAPQLNVVAGEIGPADGARTSYWALADDALLDVEVDCAAPPKARGAYRTVGAEAPRADLEQKFYGLPRYIHDLELPGMLHGRILRPPSRAATLSALDESAARACDGVVAVVRDGSLLGVLADSGRHAEQALEQLRRHAVWDEPATLPDESTLGAWLREQKVDTLVVDDKAAPADAKPVARTLKASYAKPFIAHASIAPSCAVARFDGQQLEVWTHSQGIFNLRADLALCFGLEKTAIVVQHVEGAGCYGHNPADDVAFDAAWLARAAPGRPVRVLWSRADELGWGPYGPAMAIDLEADLDANGAVLGWRHTLWSNGHGTRPGRAASPALLGSWHLQKPFPPAEAVNPPPSSGGGAERNAVPLYDFPAWRVVNHRVLAMPVRSSALRSLGAFANVFALESFIDDLAAATATEPIEFRLRYLRDPRARAVLERIVETSGWRDWQIAEGRGHGIGFARYKTNGAYCAVVAEIEAEAEIRVTRLSIVVDVGIVINPDGVINQIEGGAIQATSWALKEAVRFDRQRVTSDSWETYPILRFTDIPVVEVDLIHSDAPPVGAGEASLGPTAAAISNAVYHALGVRVTELPLTTERIIAALQ